MAAGPGTQLLLDGKKSLTLNDTDLVIHGIEDFSSPSSGQRSRGCGALIDMVLSLGMPDKKTTTNASASKDGKPATRSIPLHNILWAESSLGSLEIDYVRVTKSSVKLEKISLPLSKAAENPNEPDPATFIANILAKAYGKSKPRKRVYVLVNPNSGPGGAVKKWTQEVKPLFEAARMEMDVVHLKRGGEATELMERLDLDKYDVIVPCSGDGTPHEVFNGLGKRKDARLALQKVPVGHIPCGSGNALSWNLYGSNKADVAALGIIKGVVLPIDLVSVTQGSQRLLSFLSQSLGIVAESDLGTENLRWMGSTRFEVGLVMRVFQRKCYPCDLAVKVEVADKAVIKSHYKRHIENDPLAEQNGHEEDATEGLPALKYGTIQDALPEGWELVPHDKIGNFYCGNMPYMSADANFFPAALPADGCMDLVTINGDLSPYTATKTLLAVETGKFFDIPHVSYRKISAYRIIPRNQEDGYISIDGERVPFGPIQAEIHRGLGRVLSKGPEFDAAGPSGWENAES